MATETSGLTSQPSVTGRARTDTKKIIRAGIIVIIVAFGGFGGWAAFAPLRGAVVAPGQVKVESSRKTIQHLEGGIVGQILVKEGELVKRGQTLLVLESASVNANIAMLRDQFDTTQAQRARLTAEKNQLGKIDFPSGLVARARETNVAEIMLNETRLFNTRKNILSNEISLINGQIAQAQRESVALEQQISATDKTIGYLNEELRVNEALASKGFVAAPRLLEFKRALSQQDRSLGEYSADIERANQKVSELKLRIANLQYDYVKKAADELKQTQEKYFDLQERMRVPQDQLTRQTITSPVEGRVVGLKVHTVGGVIGAREPLMDIVPMNSDLLIEAKVRVDDIEEIHPDMDAEVRLTAYKQRVTPLVRGRVIDVSADSLIDEATHQPYYLAHIKVSAASIKEAGAHIELYPGMPAEVYLLTKARTALDYLLEPILDTVRRSMREA
jgi:HlyD family type I secretion membrane fusion protein